VVGLRAGRDDEVDPDEQQRPRRRQRVPGPSLASSDSSLTATPESQPQ